MGRGTIPSGVWPVCTTVTSEQQRPQRTTMHSIATRIAAVPLAALAAASGATLAATVLSAAPASAATKVTTVKAVETDFHIALSKKSFKPGKYTFVAQNKGQTTHALMIT